MKQRVFFVTHVQKRHGGTVAYFVVGEHGGGFFTPAQIHDFLLDHPTVPVRVAKFPFPRCLPAHRRGRRFVRSWPDKSVEDNLLNLPPRSRKGS
ncbi:MAG: DUF3892 domain-containing protein [Oscillospiraceae bacterium]|jgi:hypothetical protein|nr:DUF3892 domain-containing protein [Oscillospiraceae bacterium]